MGLGKVCWGSVRFGAVEPGKVCYGQAGIIILIQNPKNMKKYDFRPGFAWKADPEEVGRTIEKLSKQTGGEVSPAMVVEEAKKKNSPLHNCFEWNNTKAAEKWRIHQARLLLGSIVINFEYSEAQTIRAFLNIQTPEKQTYSHIDSIINDEAKMQFVIDQLKRKLALISEQLKTYENLKEHSKVIEQLILEM